MFERHQHNEDRDRYNRRMAHPRDRDRSSRWMDYEGDHSANEFDERFARGSRDMRERGQPQFERHRASGEWEGGGGPDRGRDEQDFGQNQRGSQRLQGQGERHRGPYEYNYDLAHEGQRDRYGSYPSQRLSPASYPGGSSYGSYEAQQGWGGSADRPGDFGYSYGGRERDRSSFSFQHEGRERGGRDSYSSSASPSSSSSSPAERRMSMRGKGPKGYQRSDERIREELCDELTRHHEIDASSIEVEVKQGEVSLKGSVQRRQEKYLAEDLSEDIMGVKEVHNFLRVGQENQRNSSLDRPEANMSATQAKL